MTVELCAALCAGYNFYGVEYGSECYCGNDIQNGAFRAEANSCDIACAGNTAEACGGRSFINIYEAAGSTATISSAAPTPTSYHYTSVGCFVEPTAGAKALTQVYSSSDMTHELCFYDCWNGGYNFAGLEYGQECWCGNTVAEGTTLTDDSACSFACAGDSTETCGAGNTLQLYALDTTSGVTSTTSSAAAIITVVVPL